MCRIQLRLRSELKNFGLNPSEWTLHKLTKKKFKITHVADNNFYFVGDTKTKGPSREWKTVQLISI